VNTLLEIAFRDESTFRRFVEEQVRRGRVVAQTEQSFELYATVVLRLTARDRSLDIGATVVNPVIPTQDGRAVGLEIELSRAEWTGLEWLLNVLMRERLDTVHDGRDPGEDTLVPNADVSRPGRVDDTLAREVLADSSYGSHQTGFEDFENLSLDDGAPSLPGSLIASLESAPDQSSGWRDNSNPWLDDSRYGFGRGADTSPSAAVVPPSSAASVDDRAFDSDRPIVDPMRARADSVGDYRTENPRRAQAAEEHFESARQALRRGDIAQARSSASLAIANNPTEPEYTDLLELIERRLMDRSVPGTPGS